MSRHIVIIGLALRKGPIKNDIAIIRGIETNGRKIALIELRNLIDCVGCSIDKSCPYTFVCQVEHLNNITHLETDLTLQASVEDANDGA